MNSYYRAFRRAKLCVANAVTLRYFDPDKAITIECDASGSGIGGVLLQDEQPILFISQALTDTQKCYSNIEQELLVVVVVVERLHHYIFGRKFRVNTDHSPLVSIFQKCLNDMSPHLQHLLLRLTQYQMNVVYVTHKFVPMADCLSCLVDAKTGKEDPTLNLQIANVRLDQTPIDWDRMKKSYLRQCHHGQIGKNYTVGLA